MDRRNVDPVVSGTSGGAQGRSSWEGGAEGAKKKKDLRNGSFFLVLQFLEIAVDVNYPSTFELAT